jgi:mRNA interferase MazF
MIDKPQSIAREKVGLVFGYLDDNTLLAVNPSISVIFRYLTIIFKSILF